MPTITVTLDVTNDQLVELLRTNQNCFVTNPLTGKISVPETELYHSSGIIASGDHVISKWTGNLNLDQLFRKDRTGSQTKLNEQGMKKVWELHNEGLSSARIALLFNHKISRDTVQRLVKKISTAGKRKA